MIETKTVGNFILINPPYMATIREFEQLQVWQKARTFSRDIYDLTMKGSFSKDWALRNQINESSGSIMDNIAEGFERSGTKEFIAFLAYAKGSAGESRSQLYRALDRKHISDEEFSLLKNQSIEISSMISGFITYLKRSNYKGSKFHEPSGLYECASELDHNQN